MALFEEADLTVRGSSDVDYKANVEDPRIDEVRILRPQEIPRYVAEGMFDLDITETGRAIRAAGLKIIDTILTSYTELIAGPASYADPTVARFSSHGLAGLAHWCGFLLR